MNRSYGCKATGSRTGQHGLGFGGKKVNREVSDPDLDLAGTVAARSRRLAGAAGEQCAAASVRVP